MNKNDFKTLKKMKRCFIANMFVSIISIVLLIIYYILGFFHIEVKKHEILPIFETVSLSSKFSLLFMILFIIVSLIKIIINIIMVFKFYSVEQSKNKNISSKIIFYTADITTTLVFSFFSIVLFWYYFIFFFLFAGIAITIDIIVMIFPIKKIKKEIQNLIDKGEIDVEEPKENDISVY